MPSISSRNESDSLNSVGSSMISEKSVPGSIFKAHQNRSLIKQFEVERQFKRLLFASIQSKVHHHLPIHAQDVQGEQSSTSHGGSVNSARIMVQTITAWNKRASVLHGLVISSKNNLRVSHIKSTPAGLSRASVFLASDFHKGSNIGALMLQEHDTVCKALQ